MSLPKPIISIVTPTYNRKDELIHLIESIQGQSLSPEYLSPELLSPEQICSPLRLLCDTTITYVV